MSVDPRVHGYTAERTTQLLAELRRRVSRFAGRGFGRRVTDVCRYRRAAGATAFTSRATHQRPRSGPWTCTWPAPGYFKTLGIPRVAGRDFGNETAAGPKVAMVNEAFVARVFKARTPSGGASPAAA